MLGYHVFDGFSSWLADDESTWTQDYAEAASFSDPQLAKDIGHRANVDGKRIIYVMGVLPA